MKNNSRIGIVDFWRFVFSLLIMAFHMQNFGYQGKFHFSSAWVYVEFFFILTGYFTANHFVLNEKDIISDNSAETSIKYTIRKYSNIIVYVIIVIINQYIYTSIKYGLNFKSLLLFWSKIPYEIFFLSDSMIIKTQIGPLWYLSAMFMTLPFVCYLLQKKKDLYMNILSWLFPVIYYGYFGIYGIRDWPHDFIRAFACLSLGVFIYLVSEKIKRMSLTKSVRIILTCIELYCFFVAISITYMKNGNSQLQVFMLYLIIGSIIMFSQQSYTSNIKSGILSFLGKFSLLLYLCQSTVGKLIGYYFVRFDLADRTVLYYILTILYAAILFGFVELVKKIYLNKKMQIVQLVFKE